MAVRTVAVLGAVLEAGALLLFGGGAGAAGSGGGGTAVDHVRAKRVTLVSLLREMVDRDSIARLPEPPYLCKQASSYDRRSKTPDDPEGWFANHDWSQFVRSEFHQGRREWVMLDTDGPGCVVRIWGGGHRPPGKLRFYLDGAEEPALAAPMYELLTSKALVPAPLSIENARVDTTTPGGMNLFLPIPYARHCTITYDGVNPGDPTLPPDERWYNIEYRAYSAGTSVETFTSAAYEKARGEVDRVCRTLLSPRNSAAAPVTTGEIAIGPGREVSLDLPSGPAAVRGLEVKLSGRDAESLGRALRSTIVRLEFDGEESAWCPAGDLFGSGVGLNALTSWYRTVAPDGTLTCRWTMPYRSTGRVVLANLGGTDVRARLTARVGAWRWDARSMHFHANWRCDNALHTRPFQDWNYITVSGRGVYAGDTLTVFNPVEQWWGEGDEKIRVDGEAFPSHFGTGSEDYYGYSWGSTHLFQGPFSNQVRCDGPGNQGYTTVTRTRCLDAIPFNAALQFDMEVWHWADVTESYAVATYWYAIPGASHNRRPQPLAAAAPLLLPPPRYTIAGAIECESAQVVAKSAGAIVGTQSGNVGLTSGAWSDAAQLFVRAAGPGDFVEFRVPAADRYARRLTLYATRSYDYGIVRLAVNGRPAGADRDLYNSVPVASGPIDLGVFEPRGGAFIIRVEVVGSNPASRGTRSFFGLDCVVPSLP